MKQGDALHALSVVCILIITSIFFKNLFLYLSVRTLGPMKNSIVNTLRLELYNKLLSLPIGYFSEKRKGDLMSRIHNDVGEIEGSVIGAIEGWIKDPIAIIINLSVLFYISPKLTAFILISLPVMGLLVGRLTRSLKKQSVKVAEKSGEIFSTIDETLGGLRVIKAFNVEHKLKNKFYQISDDLLKIRKKISDNSPYTETFEYLASDLFFCGSMKVFEKFMNAIPNMNEDEFKYKNWTPHVDLANILLSVNLYPYDINPFHVRYPWRPHTWQKIDENKNL
jgi:subfamily B ATP-binding cassette protein MsbA